MLQAMLRHISLMNRHRLSHAVLASLLVMGCATAPTEPASPTSLAEALNAAVAEAGITGAHEVARENCGDRLCVVFTGTQNILDVVALVVVGLGPPWTRRLTSTSPAGAQPGTLGEAETNDTLYVYGLIRDPKITRMEIDLPVGTRTISATSPAYVEAFKQAGGTTQAWSFADDAGAVIYDPTGRSTSTAAP